jgi:hypothetical protein
MTTTNALRKTDEQRQAGTSPRRLRPSERCEDCAWFTQIGQGFGGVCQRQPPGWHAAGEDGQVDADQPSVSAYDRCAQGEVWE